MKTPHLLQRLMDRRNPWRGPLVFACLGLLIATIVALLPSPGQSVGAVPLKLFEQEPIIRVRVSRLGVGESITLGGGRCQNTGETVLWDQDTLDLPAQIGPAPEGETLRCGSYGYEGWIELHRDGTNVEVINCVPLESYLASVVEAEMGASFPDEALKAQAVAARSYAVVRMMARQRATWHVGNNQSYQVYRGTPVQRDRMTRLVTASRGLILTYDNKPLEGLFSSTCGGFTRSASEAFGGDSPPPLHGSVCGACNDAGTFAWTVKAPIENLRRALGGAMPHGVHYMEAHDSGRVTSVEFATESGSRSLSVRNLRRLFKGKALSDWIVDVRLESGHVVIGGRGFGHGVGLCQYGARGLTRMGADWQQICLRYYPGATLARAWEDQP